MSILVVFIGGEAALRLVYWLRDGTPFFAKASVGSMTTLDEHRGWRATENARVQRLTRDAGGSEHQVTFTQDEHGFRQFGNLTATGFRRPRVLVIGDSFTQGREVSDSETYFAILSKSLDAEVFAYGVAGYGTLQEYMALADYFTMIKPDLIIWQYCPNDFINNSPSLERKSVINNNGMRRPYLVNGRVEYILPKGFSRLIREYAIEHSRFLQFIIGKIDRIHAGSAGGSTLQGDIDSPDLAIPEFAAAVQVTDEIMGRVRQLVGRVRVVAFTSQSGSVTEPLFAQISAKHDVDFVSGLPDTLRAAQDRGVVVTAEDKAHWSAQGHRLVAGLLLTALKERCLLDLCHGSSHSR